jgi:outer membrane receptor for ferrienterochelin and colicins
LKYVILFLIGFICFSGNAQQVQILSAGDSLPVPFSTLIVKNKFISLGQTTNDKGIIKYREGGLDSSNYILIAQAVGFEKYEKVVMGFEINQLKKIYLKPMTNLSEVVVTSQYVPTMAEQAVQKIQVIDKEKIQQMGAVNLKDVLSNQLNVRLQQDNVLGSGMSLQGISGENIKILMDGVPMIGRLNGNIDLSQVNLNNIERIEFIEGPLSVQYGTNALAGTINIITKNPSKKTINTGVTGYYESIGTYNLNADVASYFKSHQIQLSGGRNYFDGWNPGENPFTFPKSQIADSNRYKQWKPKEQYFFNFGYQYNFRTLNLGFRSAYFNEQIINRGYPRAPYAESTFDDRYYTTRLDNHVFLSGKLSKRWSVNALTAYNYYNRIKKTVYKDLTTLEETLSANSSDQDTSRFTLLMSRASFTHVKDSSKLNYELGYDVNYESALGKRIDHQLQYMGDYAGFATLEYKPVSSVVIKPGLRYSYNTAYATPVIPSLNIKYALNSRHTLRGSYARGFRAPSLKELYFFFVDINHNIIGNQTLKSEQSNNYSVAYNYRITLDKCRLKIDASVFYNDIFNLITLAQTSSTQYSYVNIGKYKTMGLQLGNTLKFKRLSLQTGFTYTGRYNELSKNESVPTFNYSPEALANVSYKLIKEKVTLAVFYKYNGKLPGYALVDNVVKQTFLADYHLLDATVSKLFWKDHILLSIGCKNVLDVQNLSSTMAASGAHSASSSSVPFSTGRNYFIKLALNFSHQ